jgi:hypothetical protein
MLSPSTTTSKLDPALKARWVRALRSGRYRQGAEALLTVDGSYCCLGVLAKIQRCNFSAVPVDMLDSSSPLREALAKYAGGLSEEDQDTLAGMNDGGASFDEIADYIEEKL